MNHALLPTENKDATVRLMIGARPMQDLLKKFLAWGRDHTSPLDANSPHELLVEATELLGLIDGVANVIEFPLPAAEKAPAMPETLADLVIEAATADWEPEPAPVTKEKPEYLDRATAIKRIKAGLQKRTGRTWSVTGGRGTAYGWLQIDAPPKRRIAHTRQKPGTRGTENEDYEEFIDATKEFGHMTTEDRKILTKALGLGREIHHQGENIPAGSDYYTEYVDRAEGREPRAFGEQYWD